MSLVTAKLYNIVNWHPINGCNHELIHIRSQKLFSTILTNRELSMSALSKKLNKIKNSLSGPEARFYAIVLFFILVFFTGGGSRDDIQSLLLLRPLAILFCAYALIVKTPDQWKGRMFPLYILGALVALMVLQLIPLPPSVWTELPNRQIFAEIADLAGIEQPWRPLTLSPSKTLNSLFSLAVPIAAMMLYLNLDREGRKKVVPVILILCVISALWAIFQIVGPARGPLYIYRITNHGGGVGLFANRNHQAVLLASAIVMLSWYAASLRRGGKQAPLKFYGSLAAALVFVPLIFITGSRAGLLLMVPALFVGLFFLYFGRYFEAPNSRKSQSRGSKTNRFSKRRLALLAGAVVIAAIAVSSVLLSRSLAFDRLFDSANLEELRVLILPTLFTMLKDYFPWGIGFGTFEHLYKIYEPQELLMPSYVNQAHNDWLQLFIEGGAPVLLIAAGAMLWFAKCLTILIRNWRSSNLAKYRALMCVTVMLFMLAASVGDYPLRVPSMMTIFAVIACLFIDSVRSVQQR